MEFKYYSLSELKNMKFPTTWLKNNHDEIEKQKFNKHFSVPIVANIEGRKVIHILSEFEYLGSHMIQQNNKNIPCIYYPSLTKEEAIDLLIFQSNKNPFIEAIRLELELLSLEEKRYHQLHSAFDVTKNDYLQEINVQFEGQMRKINEKSLISIYEKCKLDNLFNPLNIELAKQVEILCNYTKRMLTIMDDEKVIPKITMFRYLWAIYEAVFELMVFDQISFNSPEYDALLKKVYAQVLKDDVKMLDSIVAETNTYALANKHKNKIKELQQVTTFNPFNL